MKAKHKQPRCRGSLSSPCGLRNHANANTTREYSPSRVLSGNHRRRLVFAIPFCLRGFERAARRFLWERNEARVSFPQVETFILGFRLSVSPLNRVFVLRRPERLNLRIDQHGTNGGSEVEDYCSGPAERSLSPDGLVVVPEPWRPTSTTTSQPPTTCWRRGS